MKKKIFFICAIILMAFPFNTILLPNKIAGGGVSGIAVICNYVFNINTTSFIFIMNFILLILAFVLIDKKFAIQTIIGANILYPLFLWIIPKEAIVTDPLFGVIISGILYGIGLHLFNISEGSNGGSLIPAKIISKYTKIKFVTAVLMIDLVIICLGMLIFDIQTGLYACTVSIIMSYTANFLDRGLQSAQAIHIITDKPEIIVVGLLKTANVAVTKVQAFGGYEDTEKSILVCVIKPNKGFIVRKIVKDLDEKSFMYTTQVSSTSGGTFAAFSNIGNKY